MKVYVFPLLELYGNLVEVKKKKKKEKLKY